MIRHHSIQYHHKRIIAYRQTQGYQQVIGRQPLATTDGIIMISSVGNFLICSFFSDLLSESGGIHEAHSRSSISRLIGRKHADGKPYKYRQQNDTGTFFFKMSDDII